MWGRKRGSKVLGQSSRQKEKNIQVPEARVWPLEGNESAAEWPEHKAHSSLFPRSSKGHGTGSSTLNACWIKTSWRKCRGSGCRQVKRGLGEARKYECWGWWHWLGAFIGIQNLLDHPYTHTHTHTHTRKSRNKRIVGHAGTFLALWQISILKYMHLYLCLP